MWIPLTSYDTICIGDDCEIREPVRKPYTITRGHCLLELNWLMNKEGFDDHLIREPLNHTGKLPS